MKISVLIPNQRVVARSLQIESEVFVPGLAIDIELRPLLTFDEAEAFYIAGGEEAFYDGEQQLNQLINQSMPLWLGE